MTINPVIGALLVFLAYALAQANEEAFERSSKATPEWKAQQTPSYKL